MYKVNNEEKKENIQNRTLIVSWTLDEQNKFKNYLWKIASNESKTSFGDEIETKELMDKLIDRNVLDKDIIKLEFKDIVKTLKEKIIDIFKTNNDINENDKEKTTFLTTFAMAIQDTKKRKTFIPQNTTTFENCDDNLTYFSMNKLQKTGNQEYDMKLNYITKAKTTLLVFATLLTRIGKNCKINIDNTKTMRFPRYFGVKNGELTVLDKNEINIPQQTVNLIDTNNFLELGKEFDMGNLCGITAVEYYKNLYAKLFDFAIEEQKYDGKNIEFTIPLGGAWGKKINNYIICALNQLLAETNSKYYNSGINIRLIGTPTEIYKERYKIKKNGKVYWKLVKRSPEPKFNFKVLDYRKDQPLYFSNDKTNSYMIMAGNHIAFLGNAAMKNCKNEYLDGFSEYEDGENSKYRPYNNLIKKFIEEKGIDKIPQHNYNMSSSESLNMLGDFHKYYNGISTNEIFNKYTGIVNLDINKLRMPKKYKLHYSNKIIDIDENKKKNINLKINSDKCVKQSKKNNKKTTSKLKVVNRIKNKKYFLKPIFLKPTTNIVKNININNTNNIINNENNLLLHRKIEPKNMPQINTIIDNIKYSKYLNNLNSLKENLNKNELKQKQQEKESPKINP